MVVVVVVVVEVGEVLAEPSVLPLLHRRPREKVKKDGEK